MNEVEEFYSKDLEEMDEKFGDLEKMPEQFLEFLDSFVSRVGSGRVLDAGCWTGRDTEFFSEHGLEAVGIDLATDAIEHANDNRRGDYREMDMRDLEFENSSFNGVWCTAAIFFMPKVEMKKALEEFHRVLKPDGILYVSIKLGEGENLKTRKELEITEHLLSQEEAEELVEQTGFKIESRHHTQNPKPGGKDFFSIFAHPR